MAGFKKKLKKKVLKDRPKLLKGVEKAKREKKENKHLQGASNYTGLDHNAFVSLAAYSDTNNDDRTPGPLPEYSKTPETNEFGGGNFGGAGAGDDWNSNDDNSSDSSDSGSDGD